MVMSPFELTIELKTPFVFGHNPIRLDGLIWHCLFLEYGCPDIAKAKLGDFLKFNGTIYHASSAGLGVNRQTILLKDEDTNNDSDLIPDIYALNRNAIGSMDNENDLNERFFNPNGASLKKPYVKVMTMGGPYINRLNSFKAYWANALVFHGVGQGGAIADLLDFYLSAVGLNANIGFGTIGQVTAKTIKKDFSFIDESGRLARPMPIDSDIQLDKTKNHLKREAILTPPFRNQESVLCYIPNTIRSFNIKESFLNE